MRCVLYVRMSKDIQDKSPGEQREALTEYALQRGHSIVGEYIDEGVSGDATESRTGFKRMMKDCTLKHFDMILCWDQDRFGRFDPLEAGYWIKPMRDAGVFLETIAQGRVDWNDFAGRLIWSVQQESKHAFLHDLARNSLRGNLARAKEGKHIGIPPFGYVVDDAGYLALGPDEHVEAVRAAFALRKLRLGYRVIGLRLMEAGHPSPSGATWSPDAVRLILNREKYTGTFVYGEKHRGKYSTTVDGVVAPAIGGKNVTNRSPIKIPDNHPAIIDMATWTLVNAMHGDPPKPHANRGNSGAPLAGLLTCGRCGGRMYSQSLQKKSGQRTPNYICGSYMMGKGCGYCFVGQKRIYKIVMESLRERFCGGSLNALKAKLLAREAERLKERSKLSERRRLERLEKRLQSATERLLIVDSSLFRELEKQVLAMRDERNSLAAAINAASGDPAVSTATIAEELWRITSADSAASSATVRSGLRTFVSEIRLEFSTGKKTGRGQSFDFTGGNIIFLEPSEPCVTLSTDTML